MCDLRSRVARRTCRGGWDRSRRSCMARLEKKSSDEQRRGEREQGVESRCIQPERWWKHDVQPTTAPNPPPSPQRPLNAPRPAPSSPPHSKQATTMRLIALALACAVAAHAVSIPEMEAPLSLKASIPDISADAQLLRFSEAPGPAAGSEVAGAASGGAGTGPEDAGDSETGGTGSTGATGSTGGTGGTGGTGPAAPEVR